MAIRKKTVEYPLVMRTTSLAAATRHDFAAITVYIPETTSRTFTGAIVEVCALQFDATAIALTSELIGIKLGAVAFSDASMTDTMTARGESESYTFTRDVTAYFNSNFGAGASQTCQVGVQFGAISTINITAKLVLTYTYDDAAATTRVKTVRIPLESTVGALTATSVQMGTNQIPALDTFLPEASKVYRAVWAEVEGNDLCVGTTDFQYEMKIDSGGSLVLDGNHEAALLSQRWWKAMFGLGSMTTNAAHGWFQRVTNVAGGTCNHISVILYVTYEYNHSTSTTIMNSVVLPFQHTTQALGNTTTADKNRRTLEFWIEEPGAIALVQSGVWCTWNAVAAVSVSIAAGAQTARAYTDQSGTGVQRISTATMQRIDSAAAQGVGMTLARGKNALTIDAFGSSATVLVMDFDGMVYLNYTSGKHASGDGVHNHTIIESWIQTTADAVQVVQAQQVTPSIPETSYFASHVGVQLYSWAATSTGGPSPSPGYVGLSAEAAASELYGAGWPLLVGCLFRANGTQNGFYVAHGDGFFNRYPGDPAAQMDLEVARTVRYDSTPTCYCLAAWVYYTYHAITFAHVGALDGYSGDGSGVTVNLHRSDNDEKVASAVSTTGGNYSITWYDDTIPVYAVARQAADRVGRSDNVAAA